MRNGTCIKCDTETVRQLTRGIDRGRNAPLYVTGGGAVNRASSYETFLCTSCGYFEDYVTDVEKLQAVAAGDGGWARPV
jgi:hypothetical protein